MSTATASIIEELKKLPDDDKREIIDALWESFADSSFPISDETMNELERRLDECERKPARARPWPEVEKRIKERLAAPPMVGLVVAHRPE